MCRSCSFACTTIRHSGASYVQEGFRAKRSRIEEKFMGTWSRWPNDRRAVRVARRSVVEEFGLPVEPRPDDAHHGALKLTLRIAVERVKRDGVVRDHLVPLHVRDDEDAH